MNRLMTIAALIGVVIGAALSAPPVPQPQDTNTVGWWANALPVTVYGTIEPSKLEAGTLIRLDGTGTVTAGSEITPGIYWAPLGMSYAADCGIVDMDEAAVVEVAVGTLAGGLSVTCGSGWYACCHCIQVGEHWCPVARCRQNGSHEPSNGGCQGGGPGSTSCSISRSDCP